MAVSTMACRGHWFVHLSCIAGPAWGRVCSVGRPRPISVDLGEWCMGRPLILLGTIGITKVERLCRPEARMWGSDRVWLDIFGLGFFFNVSLIFIWD